MRSIGWWLLLLAACGGPARAPESPRCAPEDRDGFQDEDGCLDADDDADAIDDIEDRCPCEAEDIDGFEDGDGCPDPDNDADGIVDECDLCPNEPESMNHYDDGDGCPDTALVRISAERIVIVQHVFFMKDSAQIRDESVPIIEAMADVLRTNPQIEQVEIQGHASVGERHAMELSQHRAEAVRQALIDRGVDPNRLVAVGYGTTRPINQNDTPEGRAMNRRIETVILRSTPPPEVPPPPPVRCPDGPPAPRPRACDRR